MIHAIDVAISQLGVQEKTGHNDGIPAQRYMRGDELEWCAGFVLFCNANSDDRPLARNNKEHYRLRSVKQFILAMQERGWFLPLPPTAPKDVGPRTNDVIFFGNAQSDVGVTGHHVGLVEKVENGRVYTIEGNLSNQVMRASYQLDDPRIVGYARPNLPVES